MKYLKGRVKRAKQHKHVSIDKFLFLSTKCTSKKQPLSDKTLDGAISPVWFRVLTFRHVRKREVVYCVCLLSSAASLDELS